MAKRPVNQPYTITNTFGAPDSYALFGYHSGVDYAVAMNTPVYAPAAGQVVYAQEHPVRGRMVVIFDGRYYHRLMHNSAFNVSVGQPVTEGQQVARSGNTGLSTGPHVHWDINGRGIEAQGFSDFVDPAKWLAANPQGEGMAELVDINTARILAHGILGRNGRDGTTNALSGADDEDLKKYHVGQPLTTAFIRGLYNANEAVKFRERQANPDADAVDAAKYRAIKEALKP